MSNPISKAGYHKLKEEWEFLYHTERPRIVADVAFAAAQGDRSENADYIYGKKKLREIDKRMRELEQIIKNSRVIDSHPREKDFIRFGAIVELQKEDGEKRKIKIVGKDEIEPSLGHLSKESPFGQAVLGKKESDWVSIQTPKGLVRYQILKFYYGSDSDGSD